MSHPIIVHCPSTVALPALRLRRDRLTLTDRPCMRPVERTAAGRRILNTRRRMATALPRVLLEAPAARETCAWGVASAALMVAVVVAAYLVSGLHL